MDYNIAPTVPSDIDKIWKLNENALPAVNSITKQDFYHFIKIADYFKTIFVGGGLVGYLIALQKGRDYNSVNYKYFEAGYDKFIYVDRIVIDPDFQNNGLGRAFYYDLSLFSEKVASIITCEVNIIPPNEGSMAFHKSLGFKKVDTQLSENNNKKVALMVLEL